MKWNEWWNEIRNEKKWKSLKFFGIVDVDVVNEFEKIFYEILTQSHSGMEIWSIENPGFEPEGKGQQFFAEIRTRKFGSGSLGQQWW